MSFNVAADAYGRFMGRYSEPLAAQFLEFAGVPAGRPALDVGCGPGALTAQLVDRLGPAAVSAIDPSGPFVESVRKRLPGVDVRVGSAEDLPYPGRFFGAALAQLVVHFMEDPVAGLAQMGRVTREDGVVAACVWDHAGNTGPLSTFWEAAHQLDSGAPDESGMAGAGEGQLAGLCEAAGLRDIEAASLTVALPIASFADWWDPFTLGVGPAGAYVRTLDIHQRDALAARCRQLLPSAPFTATAAAWCVRARP